MPLIPIEHSIIDAFEIEINKETINFQFPPKVSTDTRTATWEEHDAAGTEEVAVFMGSRERVFQIEWTYIVGAVDGSWGVEKVAGECSKARNYFFAAVIDAANGPVAKVKLASHGDPDKPMTMRLSDLNIKHGTAYVSDSGKVYPLRTDITMTAKIFTQKAPPPFGVAGGQIGPPQQPIKSLEPTVSGLWI